MGQCVLLSLLLNMSTPQYAAGLQVLRSEHRAGKTPPAMKSELLILTCQQTLSLGVCGESRLSKLLFYPF